MTSSARVLPNEEANEEASPLPASQNKPTSLKRLATSGSNLAISGRNLLPMPMRSPARRRDSRDSISSQRDSSGRPSLKRSMTKRTFDDDAFAIIAKAEREIETARRLDRARAMRPSNGIIDPRSSSWMPLWDFLMLSAVLFVAIVTPVEVAFLGDGRHVSALWIVNRIIDAIFTIDILINFNLAYQEPIKRGGHWVLNRSMVARKYVCGWLFIDFITIVPWWSLTFDWANPVKQLEDEAAAAVGSTGRVAVLVRIVKLLRLLRLARISKSSGASRFVLDVATGRWEWTYAVIQAIKLCVWLIFYSHWQACAWGLFSSYQEDDGYPNWLSAFNQGHMDTFGVAAGPVDRYIAALYWSMMTVTGIGYGEMLPINTTERAFCTLWMLIAGAVWTYIIGTVALIATTLDPNGVSFHNTMDSLNCFMRERELPRHMRMMLRDYFTSARRVHQLNDDFKIISMMSPMLEGEVAVATNRRWLQRVWYFRDLDTSMEGRYFIVSVAKKLVIRAYVATERLPVGQLYILRRGLCVKMWRFIGMGNTWGEDIILDNQELVDHSQAVALTYVECYTLRRNDMEEALAETPAVWQTVRKAARKLSLQRALIQHLVNEGQGRNPVSFATKSASRGYTTVQADRTMGQKLDEIGEKLRFVEEREERGNMQHAMNSTVKVDPAPSLMHARQQMASPVKGDEVIRIEPAVWEDEMNKTPRGAAVQKEVAELKAAVLEMRSLMLSEMQAVRDLISQRPAAAPG